MPPNLLYHPSECIQQSIGIILASVLYPATLFFCRMISMMWADPTTTTTTTTTKMTHRRANLSTQVRSLFAWANPPYDPLGCLGLVPLRPPKGALGQSPWHHYPADVSVGRLDEPVHWALAADGLWPPMAFGRRWPLAADGLWPPMAAGRRWPLAAKIHGWCWRAVTGHRLLWAISCWLWTLTRAMRPWATGHEAKASEATRP